MDNKISFLGENGENIEFSVLEETRLNGNSYILVTDSMDDENGECYIMKKVSDSTDGDANYIFVEDDMELNSVFAIFEELTSDSDTQIVR